MKTTDTTQTACSATRKGHSRGFPCKLPAGHAGRHNYKGNGPQAK